MRRRVASAALAACAVLTGAVGAGAGDDVGAAAEALRVVSWEQDGGTTVALAEDHRVPLVHLRLDFPAGTWSPWVRAQHAEEAFEIQMHDPEGRLRARADELGLDISLDVQARSAVLTLDCHREDVGRALALVRDVLTGRAFDRGELRRRRAQRGIAWKAQLKDPNFVLMREVVQAVFREDDPRRLAYEPPQRIVTDTERLARARDGLLALPGRIAGWGGAVTREEAERWTRELNLPTTTAAPPGLEPRVLDERSPAERGASRSATLRRLTQVYFAHARTAPGMADADYPAFVIANHVLGGHFYSRLYEALRHEAGDTYGAATRVAPGVNPSHYALYTFTRTENAAAAEDKIRATLARFHDGGITEAERAAAAGYLLGRRAFDRQTPAQLVGEFAWERLRGLPRGFRDDLVERAGALPLADVNAFIARFYDPRLFTMVTVRPKS